MDAGDKKKIGKYEITGILGRGGMGVVYRAEDKRIGRTVAIKTLTEGFTGEPEMLERFYREAQAGILQHPNIVTVYDLGDEDGMPFIVMEFVNGDALDKLITSGRPIPMIDKLSIIEQVCAALGYAHQRGIIHRDIKPANVMVERDPIHAKLVDFGIARVQSSRSKSGLTRTGSVIGTIHYIAPERLKGQPFDGRSDIFSTGVMLYYLLAGQLPFTGEDITVAQKLVNEPAPPLHNWLTNYPPALDAILDHALAKDPAQRYATAEEFAADLHTVAEELRKGQVTELYSDAERLATEEQYGRARELLFQLVRIDPQHTAARQLLGTVQQNLERLQRAEQIRQMLAEAEEALVSSRFTEALATLDQAVKLDPENSRLKERLEDARERKRRYDEIGSLLLQADALRDRHDWSGALQIVEKAMGLSQTDSKIRALYVDLSRQAKLAAQQQQIRELLGHAKQELSSRRFTAAIDVLTEVQKIDPSHPEMESLLRTALDGQEQERRRRILDQIQVEIENCLGSEDYDRATDLVDRALEKLPNEPSLLQHKTRVAMLTRQFRLRQRIDETVTTAQQTFVESPAEALRIVQKAIEEMPGEERLLTLEDSLRQRLKSAEREQIRGRYLREAQDAIDAGQFDKAVEVLEAYQMEFADAEGVGELLGFARNEMAQQRRRELISTCTTKVRQLLSEQRYDPAIRLLEEANSETEDPSLARLLAEARSQQQDAERKVDALLARIQRLREQRKLDEAVELLHGLPSASVAGTQLNALLNEMSAELRTEQARKEAITKAFDEAAAAAKTGDFNTALTALTGVQRAWGKSEDLARATAEVESARAQKATASVEKAVEVARAALLANDTATAKRELQAVADQTEFVASALQSDWRRLCTEAAKPPARKTGQHVKVDFEKAEKAALRTAMLRKASISLAAVAVLVIAAIIFWTHRPTPKVQPNGNNIPPAVANLPTPPPSGTLVVQGNVDNVGVFVDGPIKGFTQTDGTLRLPLDPGPHAIRFVKAGYADAPPASVTIQLNTEATVRFSLTKSNSAAAPPETDAYLTIHSTPGALIRIDHNPQAKADARGGAIVQVKPGTRLLEIGLDGFQSYSQTLNLKAGEHNNVAVSLNLVPVAPRPSAPTPQPVQIYSFTASARQIEQGQSTTLKWQTANASEVTIDNGIGRVESSEETTVRPNSSTTYVLTARGNGGVQQRSVNVLVEAHAERPVAPAPVAPRPVDESALVAASLNSFRAAWNTHDMGRLKAAWTGMQPSQAKAMESFFKNFPNASVVDNCPASALSISGDVATWSCTEITTIYVSGKPQSSPHGIRFTFAKRSGNWTIQDRR